MPQAFTPPSRRARRSRDVFWSHTTDPIGLSVLKVGTTYTMVEDPSNEDIAAATIAYLGGRTYPVSTAEAQALTTAGYSAQLTVTDGPQYGLGYYGSGIYGS